VFLIFDAQNLLITLQVAGACHFKN